MKGSLAGLLDNLFERNRSKFRTEKNMIMYYCSDVIIRRLNKDRGTAKMGNGYIMKENSNYSRF